MVTTVQVRESTLQLLRAAKDRTSLTSYDEVIVNLIKSQTKKSMAGALSCGKKFSKKEILENLRDESDRI